MTLCCRDASSHLINSQVNGLGGETRPSTCARIHYDIDYMRNWSLGFDLMIIGKTLVVVWRDQNAY